MVRLNRPERHNSFNTVMQRELRDTWQAIKSTGSNQNFHHNTVQRTFATAVFLLDDNSTFANNTVMDVALIPGLGENNWGYIGLRCTGSNVVVSDNRFTDIGYIAMVIERV